MVALMASVIVLYLFPFVFRRNGRVVSYYVVSRGVFWWFVVNWLMLTWIGSCVVEYPYVKMGELFSVLYFMLLGVYYAGIKMQDRVIGWF